MQDTPLQIVILGHHRSGSSALAGLVRLMGAWLGRDEELAPPHINNPKGFMERNDVIDVNTELLHAAGMDIITHSGLNVEWVDEDRLAACREKAASILTELERHGPVWATKDPRLCITLPFWLPLLSNAHVLVPVRHPMDIASSMQRRGDCSIHTALAFWEVQTVCIIRSSQDLPVLLIDHRELMRSPATAARRIADAWGNSLSIPDEEKLASWIDPTLAHSEADEETWQQASTTYQQELYRAFSTGEAWGSPGQWTIQESSARAISEHNRYVMHMLKEKEYLRHQAQNLEEGKRLAEEAAAHRLHEIRRIVGEVEGQLARTERVISDLHNMQPASPLHWLLHYRSLRKRWHQSVIPDLTSILDTQQHLARTGRDYLKGCGDGKPDQKSED